MGHYTELKLDMLLRSDTPLDVLNVLYAMVYGEDLPKNQLPQHVFFQTDRWDTMFTCMSAYHDTPDKGVFESLLDETYKLTIHSSFKDYCNEIDKFVNWIDPYVIRGGRGCIGYYQDGEVPVHIYIKDKQLSHTPKEE